MRIDRIEQLLKAIALEDLAFSGRYIPLDNPDMCWVVLSGALDLFSAHVEPDGS